MAAAASNPPPTSQAPQSHGDQASSLEQAAVTETVAAIASETAAVSEPETMADAASVDIAAATAATAATAAAAGADGAAADAVVGAVAGAAAGAAANGADSSATTTNQPPAEPTKRSVLKEILSKRMGICLVTGFASGMPLFVLINLLAAFLRKEGLDLKTIGVFSLIMFPYTWKFLWAPFVDRFSIFHLGRRKDWILLSQAMLIASIGLMGMFDPKESLLVISILSIIIAFSSATQDIVLDAYRREFLPDHELGLGNAIFVNAYRVAGLIPGGVSLIMADYVSWQIVFWFTAICLVPCFILSFFLREQEFTKAPRNLKEAVVEPFREFITRRGLGYALFIVCFVFLYKIGDSMALALATPFYMDLGYDLTTIGIVAKNVGLWSTVIGGLLGGVFMLKLGINRALWVFGVIQVVTILGFVLLAHIGQTGTPSVWLLALVLVGEYGGGGLGTSAFVAFIAKETNPTYTATQLALLSSFSAVPRTFCNATTGYLVEGLGWENFFIFCTAIAIPGMLLLFKVAPWNGEAKQQTGAA